MTNLLNSLALLFLNVVFLVSGQTACDYEVQYVSTQMGNFNTKAYIPLNPSTIYDRLNSLRATVLGTYQLCFNKMIIDPDSIYPQNERDCLHGLYNVSLLTNTYTGNFQKIKSDIDIIAKIVFSTQNDCRPVLNYKGWDNFTNDCKSMIPSLDDLFNQYGQQIQIGKTGLQYINSMILLTQRLRKLCGFNVLVKANLWTQDTCEAASNDWLYPLTDQMDTYIIQNKYVNFTSSFYNLYQSLYRVQYTCNISLYQKNGENEEIQFSDLQEKEKFLTVEE